MGCFSSSMSCDMLGFWFGLGFGSELGSPILQGDEREASAVAKGHRPVSSSRQVYEASLVNKNDGVDPVGIPKQHLSALQQVC